MKILVSEQFLNENKYYANIEDALHFLRLKMKKEGIGMDGSESNQVLDTPTPIGEQIQFSFSLYQDGREMIRKLNVRLTVEKEGLDLYYDVM